MTSSLSQDASRASRVYRLSDRGDGHAGRIHLTTGRCEPGSYPGLYHQCRVALDWLEFLQTSASALTYLGRDQRYNNAQTHLDGERRHTTDYCFSQYRIHCPSAYTLFAHQISPGGGLYRTFLISPMLLGVEMSLFATPLNPQTNMRSIALYVYPAVYTCFMLPCRKRQTACFIY